MATQVSLNSGAVASAGALAIQTNGTTQAVSISTGQVATLAQNPILTSGTANGVAYLNGSKVLTTGSALTWNGSALGVTGTLSATGDLSFSTVGSKVNFATTSSATVNYVGGSADGFSLEMVTQRGASQPLKYKQDYGVGHVWSVAGSDKMTLDASGNLLVGTTSAPTGGAVSTWQNAGSSRWSMGPNGGTAFVVFNTSNVGCYVVDGQTGWTGTSDGTLKNVIAPITNGLSSISALKPTIYSWKSDEANTPYAGLIAQEVQSVFPSLVNDNNGTLGVNYTGVIPYLISAIQEQQALITTLTARITALESA